MTAPGPGQGSVPKRIEDKGRRKTKGEKRRNAFAYTTRRNRLVREGVEREGVQRGSIGTGRETLLGKRVEWENPGSNDTLRLT